MSGGYDQPLDSAPVTSFVSLQGSLLVASPALSDPNFSRAVLLVTEHSADGAMGLVLNRPLDLSAAEAVPFLAGLVEVSDVVYEGGPVRPQSVLALAEFSDPSQAAAIAFGDVGFLAADGVESPASKAVVQLRVFAGYAGWGAGQLDAEVADQAWFVAPATQRDVFTAAASRLWSVVLDRLGGRYRLVARMPLDPSLN
jgi:putative transcriptional regulator